MAAERRKKAAAKKTAKKRPKKRTPKSSAAEIAIEKRREKATKLRLAGWSMRDIAAHLKCSLGTVHSDLTEVLTRTSEKADDTTRRERAVTLARLDVATKGIWAGIENGDVEAVDRLVKIEARRAKMLGFDAPSRQEHTGPEGGPIPITAVESLGTKLDGLRKRLAGGAASEPAANGTGGVPSKPE